MTQFFADNLWLIWTIISVACLTLEVCSGDFYITCFAIGALCSVAATLLGSPVWLQVLVFAAGSTLSIRLLRPRILASLERRADKRVSNADALQGRTAEVTQTIVAGGYGRVKIDGDDWKAESDYPTDIPKGCRVTVVGRESIILKVALP